VAPNSPSAAAIYRALARIIESDKPICTLPFGGTAATVKAIEAIIQVF
jgi:hypothetical protein